MGQPSIIFRMNPSPGVPVIFNTLWIIGHPFRTSLFLFLISPTPLLVVSVSLGPKFGRTSRSCTVLPSVEVWVHQWWLGLAHFMFPFKAEMESLPEFEV